MILKLFSVFDQKAGAYLPPFHFIAAGQAVRAFADTVNDPKSSLARHPADYTLFEVGTFDDLTGVLTSAVPAINLGCALALVELASAPLFDDVKGIKSHG